MKPANFDPSGYTISFQSMKIGTHENKATHNRYLLFFNFSLDTIILFLKWFIASSACAKKAIYYTVRSSLQIQRSALLDDGTTRAHYLTPGRTRCEGFYQNYSNSVFRLFIVTEYNFTISVTQFALFRSLETILVLYNLIIRVLCFNAHVTCIHVHFSTFLTTLFGKGSLTRVQYPKCAYDPYCKLNPI